MKKKSILLLTFFVAILFAIVIMPNKVMATDIPVTEIRFTGPEIKSGNIIPSTVNVESVPAEAIDYSTINVGWSISDTGIGLVDINSLITGKFEGGKFYLVRPNDEITFKEGYSKGTNFKTFYNGEEIMIEDKDLQSFNWIEAEKQILTELSVSNIPEPVIGETILPSDFPEITFNPNIIDGFDASWYKAKESYDKNHEQTIDYIMKNADMITSSSEKYADGIYIICVLLEPNTAIQLDSNFKAKINGKNVAYEFDSEYDNLYQFYIVELKNYTYKYILGDNQEFFKGKIDSYSFKIDGDYKKFDSLKIGAISLIKDTDYTVTEGSTIITLTSDGITKLNTLTAGTYDVETKFNAYTVIGKLVIKDEQKQEENEKTEDNNVVENKVEEKATNNPKTGDSIIYVLSGLILSASGAYITKKKFIK